MGSFVVLKGQQLLGAYDDEIEALRETTKTHKLGTFMVHKVSSHEDTQIFHSSVGVLIAAKSFTPYSRQGLSRVLTNECDISAAWLPANSTSSPTLKQFTAVWDTGATSSVITQQVVDACDLAAHRHNDGIWH